MCHWLDLQDTLLRKYYFEFNLPRLVCFFIWIIYFIHWLLHIYTDYLPARRIHLHNLGGKCPDQWNVFLFLLLFFLIKFGPQFSASILDYKPISVSLFIRICAITHPNVANPTIVDNGAIYWGRRFQLYQKRIEPSFYRVLLSSIACVSGWEWSLG